jgi:glycosyltransferase involved in cell wall biosynthesis
MLSTGLSLKRGLDKEPEAASVSVVVPAHNEARVIGRCVDSLLSQDVGDLQIIVVADRCTDATESIVSERAARDSRVTLICNKECPPTWAGKCNAARLGADHATGDWLAFIDADTNGDPRLLRAAISEAQRREVGLLSLLTDLECTQWFERTTQPVAMMALLSLFPPDAVNRDDRSRTFANGQFLLFDRLWYDRIGGHAAVKDDLLEDLAFARQICQAGGRVNVLRADGLMSCSMYGDSEAFMRGWMRIFLEATHRRPKVLRKHARRMLLLGWVLPACSIAAIVLGALAGGFWGGLAVILGSGSMLMQTVALVWTWHIGRQPAWSVLLYPLGTWSVYRAMRWAAQALESGEPVKWGGREYVLKPNE